MADQISNKIKGIQDRVVSGVITGDLARITIQLIGIDTTRNDNRIDIDTAYQSSFAEITKELLVAGLDVHKVWELISEHTQTQGAKPTRADFVEGVEHFLADSLQLEGTLKEQLDEIGSIAFEVPEVQGSDALYNTFKTFLMNQDEIEEFDYDTLGALMSITELLDERQQSKLISDFNGGSRNIPRSKRNLPMTQLERLVTAIDMGISDDLHITKADLLRSAISFEPSELCLVFANTSAARSLPALLSSKAISEDYPEHAYKYDFLFDPDSKELEGYPQELRQLFAINFMNGLEDLTKKQPGKQKLLHDATADHLRPVVARNPDFNSPISEHCQFVPWVRTYLTR